MLTESKLNNTKVLIFKALIDSVICDDEFVLQNNVIKEYEEMKEERLILKTYLCKSLSKILVYL